MNGQGLNSLDIVRLLVGKVNAILSEHISRVDLVVTADETEFVMIWMDSVWSASMVTLPARATAIYAEINRRRPSNDHIRVVIGFHPEFAK